MLIFVHGYNNRFGDAVFRFAQLVHNSDADVTPILFTWPSRGSLLAYGYDRESAALSRDAFEQLLDMLIRDPAVGKVDILAHSMGNYLTLETLRQMAIRHGVSGQTLTDGRASVVDTNFWRRPQTRLARSRPQSRTQRRPRGRAPLRNDCGALSPLMSTFPFENQNSC